MVVNIALVIDQLLVSALDFAVWSNRPTMRTGVRVCSTLMPLICAWTVARRSTIVSPIRKPLRSASCEPISTSPTTPSSVPTPVPPSASSSDPSRSVPVRAAGSITGSPWASTRYPLAKFASNRESVPPMTVTVSSKSSVENACSLAGSVPEPSSMSSSVRPSVVSGTSTCSVVASQPRMPWTCAITLPHSSAVIGLPANTC